MCLVQLLRGYERFQSWIHLLSHPSNLQWDFNSSLVFWNKARLFSSLIHPCINVWVTCIFVLFREMSSGLKHVICSHSRALCFLRTERTTLAPSCKGDLAFMRHLRLLSGAALWPAVFGLGSIQVWMYVWARCPALFSIYWYSKQSTVCHTWIYMHIIIFWLY